MTSFAIVDQEPVVFLPLSSLVASTRNVRKGSTDVTSLAASILALNLLQNLVVVECEDVKGVYEVAAGERRRQALMLLAKEGRIPADHPVPVSIRTRDVLTLASLAENQERVDMSPADEYSAFAQLHKEGMPIEGIADAFGTTPLIVERRLALAKASPKLFDMLRTGEINSEQLRALCAVSDHAIQEAAWKNAPSWSKTPAKLRQLVIGEKIDAAKDNRVTFIGGLNAYEAAGGTVERDLFSKEGESGFISDIALLEKLVEQQLNLFAEPFRNQGWSWIEIQPELDSSWFQRLGRINRQATVPKSAQARIKALADELNVIREEQEKYSDDEVDEDSGEADPWGELEAKADHIIAEQRRVRESCAVFSAKEKAAAGVVVALEEGVLRYYLGMVKTEDRKEAAKASGEKITGGRETKSAGRKGGISDALTTSLRAHRNIAAQAVLAENVVVAKVLQACWSVRKIRRDTDRIPVDLSIDGGYGIRSRVGQITDPTVVKRNKAFNDRGLTLVQGLPTALPALFDQLLAMDSAKLDAINAHAFAMALSLEDDHKGFTGKLLSTLAFDMADHFQPTVDNFLGRQVPKDMIVAALVEVQQASDKKGLLGMKNRELAVEAEKRLAGSRWVPALIRTPQAKTLDPIVAKADQSKVPAKAVKPKALPAGKPAPLAKGKGKGAVAKKTAKKKA